MNTNAHIQQSVLQSNLRLTGNWQRFILFLLVLSLGWQNMSAEDLISDQVVRQKVVDNGGTGQYKAIVVSEKTLPDFTIYRPRSVQGAARQEGPLPILIWCNGACSNSSQGYQRMLNEIASHGYMVVAIGAFQMTDDDPSGGDSSEKQVVNAINWLVKQEKQTSSQYYKAIDLNNIALSGHSCGGAQAIANCANTRVTTLLIMNAGMGGMSMGGASPQNLRQLHCPIIYMTGGTGDVAYENAKTDFNSISKVPVTWADLPTAGHGGTYWDAGGGEFGKVAIKWMDWRMKGFAENARLFQKPELKAFSAWKIDNRNYGKDDCDAPFLPLTTHTDSAFARNQLDETFAFGADVTRLTQETQNGRTFYNQKGQKKALMPILREQGMNSVRLRVLVNPTDGVGNASSIRTLCQQAKNQGFCVMLDLCYSDTWTNNAQQTKPANWNSHDLEQLTKDVYDHTLSIVKRMKSSGVKLPWVQIGNEAENGVLWEEGRINGTNAQAFVQLLNSAYDAVKEIDPEIQVLVHSGECQTPTKLTRFFDALQSAGAKWDAIGLTAFPKFSNLKPAGFITHVAENVTTLRERYGKPVFIVETGYTNSLQLEANNFLCDFISALIDAQASGLFYREPERYEDYNLGAWNPLTNQPSIALDAFLGLRHIEGEDTGIGRISNGDSQFLLSVAGQRLTVQSDSPIRQVCVYTPDGRLLARTTFSGQQQVSLNLGRKSRNSLLLVTATTDRGTQTRYINIR